MPMLIVGDLKEVVVEIFKYNIVQLNLSLSHLLIILQ